MCVSFFSFLFVQLFHHQTGPPKRIERDAKLGEKTFTANRKLASFSLKHEYLSVKKKKKVYQQIRKSLVTN